MSEEMEQTVDMVNRDPNNLNDNVKVMFEDVIGEPEGAHSIDCVWANAFKCYNGGKKCCYLFLTVMCGLPMALCWGCEFACITFTHIWQITPCLKSFHICCECSQRFFQTCISCFLAPCCETCGLMFSKISVTQG